MKTTPKTSHRMGTLLGKAWRGWLRLENRAALWLKKIRIPATFTKIALRLSLVVGLVAILFANGVVSLLWAIVQILIMMVLLLLILAYWPFSLETSEEESSPSYFPEDPDDHRNQPGYDKRFYPEDDPDPRFED